LSEKPEMKRSLRRPRCRWENNIKIDLRKIGSKTVNWIQIAQGRGPMVAFVNMMLYWWVP
jgi:hypothetical protein